MRKKLTLAKLRKILTLEEFHYIFSFYIGGLKSQLAFFSLSSNYKTQKAFSAVSNHKLCNVCTTNYLKKFAWGWKRICTQITQRLKLPRGLRSYEFSRVDKIDEEHRDKHQNYRLMKQNYRSLSVSTTALYCVRCGLIDFFILQSLGSLTHSFIKLT